MGRSYKGTPASTAADTYVDASGYLRDSITKRLVHREVYYREYPSSNRQWHVHHINGCKTDNELSNLIALQPDDHMFLHDKWPMNRLPSREEICALLRDGKTIRGKVGTKALDRWKSEMERKQEMRARYNRKMEEMFQGAKRGKAIKKKYRFAPIFRNYMFDINGRMQSKKVASREPRKLIVVKRSGAETKRLTVEGACKAREIFDS